MNTLWRPRGPVDDRNDIGGDYQAGKAYSRRYTSPQQPEALVEVYFYPEQINPARWGVRRAITYTLCADTRRPGDTEWWSDTCYDLDREPHRALATTLADAEHAAKTEMERFDPATLNWNGERF